MNQNKIISVGNKLEAAEDLIQDAAHEMAILYHPATETLDTLAMLVHNIANMIKEMVDAPG